MAEKWPLCSFLLCRYFAVISFHLVWIPALWSVAGLVITTPQGTLVSPTSSPSFVSGHPAATTMIVSALPSHGKVSTMTYTCFSNGMTFTFINLWPMSITIKKHVRQNSQFNGLEIHLLIGHQIKLDLKKLLNTFLLFIFCFLLLTCRCTFPCRQKRRRWSFPHGCDAYTFQTGQKKEDNVVHGGSRWWARKRNIYIGSSDTWWPGKIKNLGRKF